MDLSAFDPTGARSVRLIETTLAAASEGGARSIVTRCKVEVEYEDRTDEIDVDFGEAGPVFETLQRLVSVLNRQLSS